MLEREREKKKRGGSMPERRKQKMRENPKKSEPNQTNRIKGWTFMPRRSYFRSK